MGLIAWIANKRRQAAADRAERQRLEAELREHEKYRADENAWEQEATVLHDELALAMNPHDLEGAENVPLVLHKDEFVLLMAQGATLVEPKRLPGQWVGGYSGLSFRIMKGVSYHVGGTRGTYVPGPEAPTPIATGTATITNQRVVFQSDSQAREFAFRKLIGYQHDPALPLTYFQVSNRQRVSGILYDNANARTVRFRLELALAVFRGQTELLVRDLRAEIAAHDGQRPARPPSMQLGRTPQQVQG